MKYIIQVIKRRGLRFLYDFFLENALFDFLHGTRTALRVTKNKQSYSLLKGQQDDGLLYVASFTSVVKKCLKIVIENHRDVRGFQQLQFLDLGCGKGKSLIIAAKNFSAEFSSGIMGIEYDPVLVDAGRSNLRAANIVNSAQIIQDSALNFKKYIKDGILVVYLYNSFQGDTFIGVMKELKRYDHYLIYVDPILECSPQLKGHKLIAEHNGRYNADTWKIYRYENNP